MKVERIELMKYEVIFDTDDFNELKLISDVKDISTADALYVLIDDAMENFADNLE